MKRQCPVVYARRTCEPFCLGIEGAECMLGAGHPGDHATKILAHFGDTPDQDVHQLFRFTVLG